MTQNIKIKYKFVFLSISILFLISYFLYPDSVYAVCPVCTVAVGAGLGLSRALGIDDAVTSVWIGGLILSMSYWAIDWLGKKNLSLTKKLGPKKLEITTIILMYFITLFPLWYGKYIGRLNNQYLGVDKIILGTFLGSLAFIFGKWLDGYVRKVKGKQLFNYQKVVFPVTSLILVSIFLHLIVP